MELDCSDLIPSIRARGVMLPLIVEENNFKLIAGWRRLTSSIFLNLSEVPVRTVPAGTTLFQIKLIEYEENARRKDLTWQDTARANWQLHSMCLREDPEWTIEQTAAILSQSEKHTYRMVDLGEMVEQGDKAVIDCDTIANASTILTRRRQRAGADALNSILSLEKKKPVQDGGSLPSDPREGSSRDGQPSDDGGLPGLPGEVRGNDRLAQPTEPVAPPYSILNANAHQFLVEYSGPKFNLLHCDLPYGVALNEQAGQQSFEGGGYESSPEIYWQLIETMFQNWDKFMYPSAHVMFWISMKFYTETISRFEAAAKDKTCPVPSSLKINETPLIWMKTDNKGIMSDALRRPRNIYEACLIMSTEDRHIVKPTSNAYGCPTAKEAGSIHTNEKPEVMLKYFFSMFVDSRSRVLDPTCGSGSSIRAAESLGAEAALGLEFNPEFAERAQKKLLAARGLARLSSLVDSVEHAESA